MPHATAGRRAGAEARQAPNATAGRCLGELSPSVRVSGTDGVNAGYGVVVVQAEVSPLSKPSMNTPTVVSNQAHRTS
jgi:hypothetical protein